METATKLSLEAIEQMNRAATEAVAQRMEEAEEGLKDPVDDIQLFSDHMRGYRMLDVGCGPARYADRFTSRGFDYTGIDFSPAVINIARKRHPKLPFALMSYRRLGFKDENFNGLWSCCVLNHEPKHNIQPVLQELRRVLAPGGVLGIVMPYDETCDESPHETWLTGLHSWFAYWEVDEFADQLLEAGCDVLESFPRWNNGSVTFIARK